MAPTTILTIFWKKHVARWYRPDGDWFAGNEVDEYDTITSDNESDSSDSDDELYTWPS